MGVLIMIGQLILCLAILVSLHEMGHFLAARAFGIKVEKFYLFFDAWGFKLFSFKKGDTEYGIGWLPLGGYVKISGMIDESLDKEQMGKPPEPWEFRSKPAWQRLIVMLGGVTVNLILGIFIYSMMLFHYGESYLPMKAVNDKGGINALEMGRSAGFKTGDKIIAVNDVPIINYSEILSAAIMKDNSTVQINRNGKDSVIKLPTDFADQFLERQSFIEPRIYVEVDSIVPGMPAEKAGLKKQDRIVSIDSIPVMYHDEIGPLLKERKSKTFPITVVRNNAPLTMMVTLDTSGKLGFNNNILATYEKDEVKLTYGLGAAFSRGTVKSFTTLSDQAKGFGKIFKGKIKAKNAVSGPIGLTKRFGPTWDWQNFWFWTCILSLVLAFMNLLPIPALDGGHVVFLLIEMVTGKPVSEKVMTVAQVVGMVLVGLLMVFAFGNDIRKLL
ncbi:MAG: RIP metalloprotease RseP [Bacteroidia bacterium]|nr:RIP metalloprotease RseP [Bacteroidia bacterium]